MHEPVISAEVEDALSGDYGALLGRAYDTQKSIFSVWRTEKVLAKSVGSC